MMINECLESRQPFGVVLIQSGAEVEGLGPEAVPYGIGCTAQIAQMQPLGGGQMNILAVGQERFKIQAFHREHPYLIGDVENLPFMDETPARTIAFGRLLRPWVERYLLLLSKVDNIQFDLAQLPQQAFPLACLSASLLKISMQEKQELLSVASAADFVKMTRAHYRKEVTLLSAMLARDVKEVGPFSLN